MSRGHKATRGLPVVNVAKYNLRSAPEFDFETSAVSQIGTGNMATGLTSRDNPEYLKSMEIELI